MAQSHGLATRVLPTRLVHWVAIVAFALITVACGLDAGSCSSFLLCLSEFMQVLHGPGYKVEAHDIGDSGSAQDPNSY